ncbi:hsp70 family chaperone [Annulohypoxylon bovei var. microspora]|nr:hsp70 family chaperone [Annulohypoxylon bovei var. microspora]
MKEKTDADLERVMVIGIDFGTTYNEQINLITTWPGYGREVFKVPTEIFYEHGEIMWGHDIPADAEPIRWFKLLLLREEDLDPEENTKTVVGVIADCLRISMVEDLMFHVVITVPAIWTGYAHRRIGAAVRKAGILEPRLAGRTTLTFVPEHEAVALATLCEPGRTIKECDVYIVCNAGDDTVDLASYMVNDMDLITLHEVVAGTGGLCGGRFIDEDFKGLCKARLGRQWGKLSQSGVKDIMAEWEHAIKPLFKANDTRKEYIVNIPAEAFKGVSINDESRKPIIKNGRIYFASSDIQYVFTSVFWEIKKLVDGQICKAKENGLSVTGIILVGSLGSNPYLHDYLVSWYGKMRIRVLQSTGFRP